MNVLIVTMPDDFHAYSVKLALEALNHQCTLWYTSDFPALQTHAFQLAANDFSWQAQGEDLSINNTRFDIVWNRRPRYPIMPSNLHPDDIHNAHKEIMALYQSFWPVVQSDAVWINPNSNARRADRKLYQLKVAQSLGFAIPDTLIGNDPTQIRAFVRRHEASGVIYKAFCPLAWIGEHAARVLYTHLLTEADLPCDTVLQAVPGIFQAKIEKAYELRVTYMAGEMVAVKIDSQSDPRSEIDWRMTPAQEVAFMQVQLPEAAEVFCQQFMAALGLRFGCLDFIVTPQRDIVFLEVNEQGQFLWKEELNPKVKILDAFIRFLEREANEGERSQSTEPMALSQFADEARALRAKAMEDHLVPPIH